MIRGPFYMKEDIAVPLSRVPRWGGHSQHEWSVLQHELAVSICIYEVTGSKRAAAAGLGHDNHETITGDIPTPLGWHLGYEAVKRTKEDVQTAIHTTLGIPESVWPSSYEETVKEADLAGLLVEKQRLLVPEPQSWERAAPDQKWMLAYYDAMDELLGMSPASQVDMYVSEYVRLVTSVGGA